MNRRLEKSYLDSYVMLGCFEVFSDIVVAGIFLEMLCMCVVLVDMSLEEKKKYRWIFNCNIN